MLTGSAARSVPEVLDDPRATVTDLPTFTREGWSDSAVRVQLRARRWRRFGRAILRHNGQPSRAEWCQLALANCGPRAVLTAFTAVEELGLRSWERDEIHILVPGGTHVRRIRGISTRVHYTAEWRPKEQNSARRLHHAAPALVLAAATFGTARPACGLLAAGVQQRLVTVDRLRAAIDERPRVRHRAALVLAMQAIAGGAQALSEIDFGNLCHRHGLPQPMRQTVRVERSGRRRYLDAEWRTHSGRRLVAEVDGALHLAPRRWWDDQLRQNELVLGGDTVLRFPSVVVRHDPLVVAAQLRRGLML